MLALRSIITVHDSRTYRNKQVVTLYNIMTIVYAINRMVVKKSHAKNMMVDDTVIDLR